MDQKEKKLNKKTGSGSDPERHRNMIIEQP